MIIRIFLTYYAWALFCLNGGWLEGPDVPKNIFLLICWACWGNIIGFFLTTILPTAIILIKLSFYYCTYKWFSSHF